MKKKLFFLISFLLTFQTISAQRDTEHWIAPYYDSSVSSSYTNALYLSTDSVTPVSVNIYNNNILLTTVIISKGNPRVHTVDRDLIRANTPAEAFTATTKGLYLQADRPFYCSLRIAEISHGEIITAKGKAGIGKLFYVAASPNNNKSSHSFTAGILATEDNTTVTVSWNNPAITFLGGTPTGTSHTFTLNRGQSFLFSGPGSNTANRTGFIGAKVVADKPVTLTNGSCNGNFGTSDDGSDIIMDQSVPTNRLGSTFAMVKTLSTRASLNTEGGIVIATEDNTQIFLNGATIPAATINAGQWYRINETSYITQPGTGNHANMYISTSQKAYLYQLIGIGNEDYNGGFNYIPPLNCLLPTTIDEIGLVNEMPGITSTINLKLNILTEAGANVLINGIPPTAAEGPYPLTGNTQWVTYAKEGITGNLTVTSTKAVTAGINGGYSTAGYGGYFAGFSSIPAITKTAGDCFPDIRLEVQNEYDAYQWYRDGILIPGAITHTLTPQQSGNYTVKVTHGCSVTSAAFEILPCITELTANAIACGGTKLIEPAFTGTPRPIALGSVSIISPPANGTATVNPATGMITYTSNAGYTGNDRLVYTFCDTNNNFCERVTLNLTVVSIGLRDVEIKACQYDTDPYANFDLTTAEVTDNTSVTKKYYRTMADLNAGVNEITTPENFPSAGGIIFVKVTTAEGCMAVAKITLTPLPIKKSPILVDQYICIDSRTNLDAGPGYDSYLWNTGATTSSLQGVGVGEYSVVLGKNGCLLTQVVHVRKAEDPVIKQIEISNTTATVLVNGGKPPYKYALDGTVNWQDSNIFTGLSRGQHTFYVKDAYNCNPVAVEVTVPNLVNAITPNGDNKNDYIDYSALSYKENLSFMVYDRYGNKIFTGEKFNNYKWDGTHFDKKIKTGTYWYHINWNESNKEKTPIQYTGWILVKNID